MAKKFFLASVAPLALMIGSAHAQQSAAPSGTSVQSGGIEEVVVTAERRSEDAQHAPVAISVVTGSQLVAAGITDPHRLGELVPALSVQSSGATGNIIFMRGVGNFVVSPNSDPAIAVNYDNTYLARPTSTDGLYYDLARVEVLKGPQGTLYGRNATGGAINIIPVEPQLGENSGYIVASYGSYNSLVAEGAVNIGLSDNSAIRLSANIVNHDGYNRDDTDDEKTQAARLQFKDDLTSRLTFRLSFDFAHNGGLSDASTAKGNYVYNSGLGHYVFDPSGLSANAGMYSPAAQAFLLTTEAGTAGRNPNPLAPKQFQDSDFYGTNAQIDYDTGFGTLTFLPALRISEPSYISSAADFTYQQRETDREYSDELRFVGDRIGIFDYIVGGYYFGENISNRTSISLSSIGNWLGEQFTTTSYAGYGRVTAHLTDKLRLVGGMRYTSDTKGFLGNVTNGVVDCLSPLGCPSSGPAAPPLFPLVNGPSDLPFAFPAAGGPLIVHPPYAIIRTDEHYDSHMTNSRPTYHAGVDYDVLENSLLYASYETGYRSGGFSPAVGYESYKPEYLTAYTFGMKNSFWDNRAQLNFEAFWWDYSNQQFTHVTDDLSGSPANFTQNIGTSRIRGIEIEGRAAPTSNDLLSFDVQYLDTQTLSFNFTDAPLSGPGFTTAPPLTGCPYTKVGSSYNVNCSGFPNWNSPAWTVNLGAQHTFDLGSSYDLVVSADTQYKSKHYIGFEYLPQELIAGVWRSNAQIMFEPKDAGWSATLFVNNIEGTRTPVYAGLNPTENILTFGYADPRTIGIRLAAKM